MISMLQIWLDTIHTQKNRKAKEIKIVGELIFYLNSSANSVFKSRFTVTDFYCLPLLAVSHKELKHIASFCFINIYVYSI